MSDINIVGTEELYSISKCANKADEDKFIRLSLDMLVTMATEDKKLRDIVYEVFVWAKEVIEKEKLVGNS